MISIFSLLFLAGTLTSLLPIPEIYKVVTILFSIPLILYLSVSWSKNISTWILNDNQLILQFYNQKLTYNTIDIDHIRSLTRSGGNLYVIYLKKGKTRRFWRNKLFVSNDDHNNLIIALSNHTIEFIKL